MILSKSKKGKNKKNWTSRMEFGAIEMDTQNPMWYDQ